MVSTLSFVAEAGTAVRSVLRVAARYRYGEDYRADDLGVRLARTIFND